MGVGSSEERVIIIFDELVSTYLLATYGKINHVMMAKILAEDRKIKDMTMFLSLQQEEEPKKKKESFIFALSCQGFKMIVFNDIIRHDNDEEYYIPGYSISHIWKYCLDHLEATDTFIFVGTCFDYPPLLQHLSECGKKIEVASVNLNENIRAYINRFHPITQAKYLEARLEPPPLRQL